MKYTHLNSSWTSTPNGSIAGKNARSGRIAPTVDTTKMERSQKNALWEGVPSDSSKAAASVCWTQHTPELGRAILGYVCIPEHHHDE